MRELLRSLSRRAPRYWASRPCRARPRPSCGRPVDPGGRRCGIPGDTVFVEPGSYAEPGIACPANPAATCGVAIAKDGISLIGLMHGRRQVGCRPVGAAPLKCAVCGTVVSWPNGKAAASQTCPVRWPTSRPLDARTGRSVPLAHDEPGIDRQRVFDLPGRPRDGGIGEHSGERLTRVPIKGGISEIGGHDGYCQ